MAQKKKLKVRGYKEVACLRCQKNTVKIDANSRSGICWECVNKMIDPPKMSKPKSNKPRGWAFMKEYVDADGNVFHKGIEMPKLKGKRKPTVIEKKTNAKPKYTRKDKMRMQQKASAKMFDLKKEIAILKKQTRTKRKIQKTESLLKRYERVVQGKFTNLNGLDL